MSDRKKEILQLIPKILQELNIEAYDKEVVMSLCDFVHNYVISVLQEAQNCAANPKVLTPQDITFAAKYVCDRAVFWDYKEILRCAKVVNKQRFPGFAPRIGLNLPPEKYCLNRTNYALKRRQQFQPKFY